MGAFALNKIQGMISWVCAAAAAFVALSGCDGGPTSCPPGQIRAGDGACVDAAPPKCSPGQVAGGNGVCVKAGIQGCTAQHIGEDGVCRPLPEHCPPATIPHYQKGCVPVGIEGCAEQLVSEDGLCRPTVEACPGGTIPRFDTGCVPVGIQDCAPVFLGADGRCRVRTAACPAGTFASPQLGCVPIDGPSGCGDGTWGALAGLPDTVYVDGSADPAAADGSEAKPFATIAAALDAAPPGGKVALAAGEYKESLHVVKPVSIAGRCASLVSITGTLPVPVLNDLPVIVWFEGVESGGIEGVRIEGAGSGIVLQSAKVTIEDVHVRGVSPLGIFASGSSTAGVVRRTLFEDLGVGVPGVPAAAVVAVDKSSLTLENTTVYRGRGVGIVTLPSTVLSGTGVLVEATQGDGLGGQFDGAVDFTDSAWVKNREAGMFVGGPASVSLTRVQIEDTATSLSGSFGNGVEEEVGGNLEMTSCLLTGNYRTGISAHGQLTLRGSLVEDNGAKITKKPRGGGVVLDKHAIATIEDSVLDRNVSAGLIVIGGTQLSASRTLVSRTVSFKDDSVAVLVDGASQAVFSDCVLTGNQVSGILCDGGSVATLSRCLLEDTATSAKGDFGIGGGARGIGSALSIERSVVRGNHYLAIEIADGAHVRAEESWITGTLPSIVPGSGYGVEMITGSTLDVVGSLFSNNSALEIGAFDPGSVLNVEGSVFYERSGLDAPGRGIAVMSQAQLRMTSTLLRSSGSFAVYAYEASAALSMSTIERVTQQALSPADDTLVGDGLLSLRSTVDLDGVLFSDCPRAGLLLSDTGGKLENIVSTRNRYGVVLEGSSPELDTNNVFIDNTDQDRLQGGNLAVPDAPSPLPQ
jgi:hypothetical protein